MSASRVLHATVGGTAFVVWVMLVLSAGCSFDESGIRPPVGNDNTNTNANGNANANGNSNNSNPPVCGDATIEAPEECDDGGEVSGDGCGVDCQIEAGWACTGEPSVCTQSCGNGTADPGESCDDGNAVGGDGCGPTCQVEAGWTCTSTPCAPICGDGMTVSDEECDDGNQLDGDGCAADCFVEPYFACDGEPSVCGCVIYVDSAGVPLPRTGASWHEAVSRVQSGIFQATAGCEVWVADGIYYQHQGSLDDSVSLKSGVAVYGGFAGIETARWQRDPSLHPATLHGSDSGATDRVYHVVSALSTVDATLDGFNVTRGNGKWGHNGGGVYAEYASVSLRHLMVQDNEADPFGGGIYAYQSVVTLRDSLVQGNYASEGGGMDAHHDCTVEIDRCRFVGNTGNLRGGGLRIYDNSTAEVWNTLFLDNTVNLNYGGAVLNWSGTTATFVNCTFYRNDAPLGAGAIRNYSAAGCAVHNSILWANTMNALDDFNTIVTIRYSAMQDSGWAGTAGNIGTDPQLLPPDFKLDPASPCIDTADDSVAPPYDLAGGPRVDLAGVGTPGTVTDMGCYEAQP